LSNEKKDLTRIEDLGEFIHELNQDEELPDLPTEESPFESDFSGDDLSSTFTDSSDEESTEFESSLDFSSSADFSHEEESAISAETEDDPFSSSDFETSSFESEDPFSSSTDEVTEEVSEESDFSLSDDAPFSLDEEKLEIEADFSESQNSESQEEAGPELTELEPEPLFPEESLPTLETSPLMTQEVTKEYKTPENFDDLKKFAESTSFTGMGVEGNPSFSVLIRNVQFIEDVNDIVSLLRELKLLNDEEEQIKNRLMRGTLLISRISEYAAIFLAHKLRRFDIDIQVGLSDEIHPPKHNEQPDVGLVSKFNLYQNQNHHFQFDDSKLDISQIIVAATPGLEGYQVVRYVGVASEHKMLEGYVVEDEDSEEIPVYYQELAMKLKAHALKAHANAVVGLNYQLTPLPSEFGSSSAKYRLTCTGNLVWVNKV
jgi:uncharacterized protein YbjQ (UPF0145 family)